MIQTDICIIGAGPAGLTAAIYAARSGRKVLVLEMLASGGQVNITPNVENYPGFTAIAGFELSGKMRLQAEACGAQFFSGEAVRIQDGGETKRVDLLGGEQVECGALILCMGAVSKHLGLPNETELTGAGISYCATCDGAFFRGKRVMVVGNGRGAAADVQYLCPIVEKVYWLTRQENDSEISAENLEKIEFSSVVELQGKPLQAVKVAGRDGKLTDLPLSGLFVAVGYTPLSFLAEGVVDLDERGYIRTDEAMRTSAMGIYAAGDVRSKGFRQIVTACSDGAIAAHYAVAALKKK